MTKIYEALENAGKERGGASPGSLPSSMPPSRALDTRLLALYQRLEAVLENRKSRVIEIADVQDGAAGSRIAYAFARFVALGLGKRVLLLTVGRFRYVNQVFPGGSSEGWDAALREGGSIEEYIRTVGDGSLAVSQIAASDAGLTAVLDAPELETILNTLREGYELIVIDAPGFGASSSAASLGAIADGVVLVIQSGRTRWQVAQSAMDQIAAQKGTVLGVILNQWRYYIPSFIYRRLL